MSACPSATAAAWLPSGETAQALARGLTCRQLQKLTALLEKYSGECEYNVGAGHVLGALAVEWEELL